MKAIALMTHSIDSHDMDNVIILFGEDWEKTINEELAQEWAEEDYEEAEEEKVVTKADKEDYIACKKAHWLKTIKWELDKNHYHGDYHCVEGKGIGDSIGIAVAVKDCPK